MRGAERFRSRVGPRWGPPSPNAALKGGHSRPRSASPASPGLPRAGRRARGRLSALGLCTRDACRPASDGPARPPAPSVGVWCFREGQRIAVLSCSFLCPLAHSRCLINIHGAEQAAFPSGDVRSRNSLIHSFFLLCIYLLIWQNLSRAGGSGQIKGYVVTMRMWEGEGEGAGGSF